MKDPLAHLRRDGQGVVISSQMSIGKNTHRSSLLFCILKIPLITLLPFIKGLSADPIVPANLIHRSFAKESLLHHHLARPRQQPPMPVVDGLYDPTLERMQLGKFLAGMDMLKPQCPDVS